MSTWLTESKEDVKRKSLLFLISPFLSFLYALKRIKTRSSFIVFFLFSIFFGMAFSVGNVRTEESIDGISYRQKFEHYKYIGEHEFYTKFKEYLSFEKNVKDFYFDTVAYYISRITNNYHVMFVFFAIVFAFFSLKSFKFLVLDENFDASFTCYVLAYLFMSNQIFNINGMRMWTPAWIGVYTIFQIFRNKKKRYFLLLLTTPFFHISFSILVAIVVLAYVFMRFKKVLHIVFFISFFVGSITLQLTQNGAEFLPPVMQSLVDTYTAADYIEFRSKQDTGFFWVAKVFNALVIMFLNLMIFLFVKNSRMIKANPKSKNLYLFLLIYMSFINSTMSIPSLGSRYLVLAYPIISYIWLVNFKGVKYSRIFYAVPIVFLYSFYKWLFYYSIVLDFTFFVQNPFYMIYKYLIVY